MVVSVGSDECLPRDRLLLVKPKRNEPPRMGGGSVIGAQYERARSGGLLVRKPPTVASRNRVRRHDSDLTCGRAAVKGVENTTPITTTTTTTRTHDYDHDHV